MAELDGLVVAVELDDGPAAAATHGGREGTLDLNDECLICSQFGPEYAHIRDVEWDRNRRLIGHLPSLLPGSRNVRGMMAPAGPLGKATLSRDTHQTAPPLTLLVKLAVYPGRGKANAREER